MATVKEIIKENEGKYADYEVYCYTGRSHRIHTDFIDNINEVYSLSEYEDKKVLYYSIMDEEEYNATILAKDGLYFNDIYSSGDKILVIMLAEDWNEPSEEESAQEKYDKANTKRISLKLNKNTDQKILKWLDGQNNKQGAIKDAVLFYIESNVKKED